ncbi:hypothetical protein NUW54_g3894 [Trametes sanguinea]|uniref:Uncharacterized protein n=1 Tax=Trametes sanguinea TaxID=158606 RepID=A0ACC1PZH2_9APHY|nr:hypothetical protein NUW54_g3894 [Trametes sanguinea]
MHQNYNSWCLFMQLVRAPTYDIVSCIVLFFSYLVLPVSWGLSVCIPPLLIDQALDPDHGQAALHPRCNALTYTASWDTYLAASEAMHYAALI